MSKLIIPAASVLAVGALAFSLRTGLAAPVPPTVTASANAATAATAATAAMPAALDDPTIVAIFDEANTADIETGQLAEKKGSTKAIRDFGAMLARDHGMVRQQGRDLAKKLGVTPTAPKPDPYAAQHAEAMRKLRGLRGAEFDRAFLQHEIDYHNAVISAINTTLMPAIQNAELKDLVTKVAPAFVAHRDAAKNMLDHYGM